MNKFKTIKPLEATVQAFMALLKGFMFVLFVLYLFSGLTVIKPDEVAVIKRFGRLVGKVHVEQVLLSGWVLAFPKPIDRVIKVPIKQIRQVRVTELANMNLADDEQIANTINPETEGYCVSGDENICQVKVLVKYKLVEPVKAALESDDIFCYYDNLVNELAVSELTKTAGMFSIDGLLTTDKLDFATQVKEKIQKVIDKAEFGIAILEVEIEELTPPNYLKESFEIVNSAYVDRKNFINNANSINEEKIPRAKSNAETMLTEANAYAEAIKAKAEGDAGQFLKLLNAYEANPLEVKEEMLVKTRKKILGQIKGLVLYPSLKHSVAGLRTVIGTSGDFTNEETRSSPLPINAFQELDDDY